MGVGVFPFTTKGDISWNCFANALYQVKEHPSIPSLAKILNTFFFARIVCACWDDALYFIVNRVC